MSFTAEQKRDCALRELKMRERVYPRWVENNRMSKAKAREEIDMMREIADDYDSQARGTRLL